MADYLVEIDYEARYTIAYKSVADSAAAAEEAALEAVARGDELPIVERRVYMNGGWDLNRHETRPLSAADAARIEGRESEGLPAAA